MTNRIMTSLRRGRLWRIRPDTRCPLLAEPRAGGRTLELLVSEVTGRALEESGEFLRVRTQGNHAGYLHRDCVEWV
jgi:hypothetical protein